MGGADLRWARHSRDWFCEHLRPFCESFESLHKVYQQVFSFNQSTVSSLNLKKCFTNNPKFAVFQEPSDDDEDDEEDDHDEDGDEDDEGKDGKAEDNESGAEN